MATENVGSISASLELQTDKFEKGMARAEKSLDRFASSMHSSQGKINKSLKDLNKHLETSTRVLSTQLNSSSSKVVSSLNSIKSASNKNSKSTIKSITNMEHRVTAELQKMGGQFATLKAVSSEDFTSGIKKLTKALGKSSSAIISNLKEIQAESKKAHKSIEDTGGGKNSFFSGNFGGVLGGLGKITSAMSKLTFQAFLVEQAFNQVAGVVKTIASPVIDFASSMESLRLGYAGIISSTMTQNGEDVPYERALLISEALIQRMQEEALKTSLTIEELGTALQSSMAMGLNAGMKLEEVLDLTVVAAQAVKTFGLSNQQVIQEIRGLISGDAIRAGVDQLATVLGYTTATVNKLREEGRLYEDIMERMKGFKATSEEFQNSWAGLISNLQDGISRVAGEAGKAFFKVSKEILADFQKVFFTLEEKTLKRSDGKEATVFKVLLNESTLSMAESFYNIMANILKVFKFIGEVLGTILLPVLRILLDSLDFLSQILVVITVALTPLLEGLKVISGLVMQFWNSLVEFLSPSLSAFSDELVLVTAGLGAVALAILACTHPVLALIILVTSLIGTFHIVFKNLKKPVDAFGKWLDSKLKYLEYRFKENKAMLFGDMDTSRMFNGLANTASKEADEASKEMRQSFNNAISNSINDIKKIPKDIFDGLAPKFPASKSTKSSGGGGAVKDGSNTLEKALKSLEKLIDKINKDFNNLVGTSKEFFMQDLATKYKNRVEELKNGLKLVEEQSKLASEAEKELWNTRKENIENAIKKEDILLDMKKREYEANENLAKEERLNIAIRNQYLDTKIALQNSQVSDIKAEETLFNLKKKHLEKYIIIYIKTIQQYKAMANIALEKGSSEKFNEYSTKILDIKEKLLELINAINPVEKALRENLIGGISDAFQAMAWQEKSAKEALEDLATSFTKTWTKMLFDTAVNDMFKKVFGKGTLSSEVDALVNVDVTQFEDAIISSAHAVQTCLVNELIPAIQQTASALNGETSGSTSLGGLSGLIASKNESTPSAGLTVGGETLGEGILGSFVSAIKGSANGLEGLTDSVKTNEGAVNNATNLAIPMMIASVLSASGALGKFGIVLQHVMMMMQIAQATHIMGFATGGYVSGAGNGTSDSIPARLSNGEYVMKASSVSRLGTGFLDKLNAIGGGRTSSRLPKFAFASGGYVDGGRNEYSKGGGTIVMNNTFQSLDPQANMKMMQQMYPQIRSMYINDLQNNTSVRTATRGAVK